MNSGRRWRFRVGDRVRDECKAVETGLPPIQADQLGPVEHIRITRNGQLLFEGGYTAEHDMGWQISGRELGSLYHVRFL